MRVILQLLLLHSTMMELRDTEIRIFEEKELVAQLADLSLRTSGHGTQLDLETDASVTIHGDLA